MEEFKDCKSEDDIVKFVKKLSDKKLLAEAFNFLHSYNKTTEDLYIRIKYSPFMANLKRISK